ncbi:alpha/beta fold hydrolase [Marimonas lutisalis]|uniref:alpha/beta fold hydrolase n=1 Tax=Marimonas lutisalis TaxID=2545756 RepID=UPI0010F84A40|nr:alpha/beta hydrolase [Marimonas lutisalis]
MSGTHSAACRLLLLALAALVAAALAIHWLYSRDMAQLYSRLDAQSRIVPLPQGPMQYADWGSGPAVLVIHGAGGGFDQGRLLPQAFGQPGVRWISVSRFGYLDSPLPANGSTTAQARAFAELLDRLGLERVGILAMSGGVPPALQFAQHYPERTAALVLLSSAPYTPFTAPDADRALPAWLYQWLFGSDFVFWAIVKAAPSLLDPFFDIPPGTRATLGDADLAFVNGLTETFLPVTARLDGLRNEGAAIDRDTRYDLSKITAPTLVVHARDDGINPFAIGEHTAQSIAGATFIALPSGGHLLLGHSERLRAEVSGFLRRHLPAP